VDLPTGQTLNVITVFISVVLLGVNVYRTYSGQKAFLLPKAVEYQVSPMRPETFPTYGDDIRVWNILGCIRRLPKI
jgi:hypothetical protein